MSLVLRRLLGGFQSNPLLVSSSSCLSARGLRSFSSTGPALLAPKNNRPSRPSSKPSSAPPRPEAKFSLVKSRARGAPSQRAPASLAETKRLIREFEAQEDDHELGDEVEKINFEDDDEMPSIEDLGIVEVGLKDDDGDLDSIFKEYIRQVTAFEEKQGRHPFRSSSLANSVFQHDPDLKDIVFDSQPETAEDQEASESQDVLQVNDEEVLEVEEEPFSVVDEFPEEELAETNEEETRAAEQEEEDETYDEEEIDEDELIEEEEEEEVEAMSHQKVSSSSGKTPQKEDSFSDLEPLDQVVEHKESKKKLDQKFGKGLKGEWKCWRVTSDFDRSRINRFLAHTNPKLSFSMINMLLRKDSVRIVRRANLQASLEAKSSKTSPSESFTQPDLEEEEEEENPKGDEELEFDPDESLLPKSPKESKNQPKWGVLSLSKIDVDEAVKMSKKVAEGSTKLYQFDLVLVRELAEPTRSSSSKEKSAPKPKVPKAERMEITKEMQQKARSWIIYKDKDIIAINKPAKIPVQGEGIDIVSLLPHFLPSSSSSGPVQVDPKNEPMEEPKLFLVHRLDKDTSGVMLLARSRAAARHLSEQLRAHKINKEYLAVVLKIPRPKKARITLPLEKVPNSHKMRAIMKDINLIKRRPKSSFSRDDEDDEDDDDDDGGNDFGIPDPNKKKSKKADPNATKPKFAVTDYAVCANSQDFSLVHLRPRTGRAHQLRVHMASGLNCPILGDPLYCMPDPIPPSLSVRSLL